MALQVWLPLDGNLYNRGLSDVTITNNGAVVDNNGKIGKCYYFNGSSYIRITVPTAITSIKNLTIAAWVKSTSTTLALGGLSHDAGNNTIGSCTLYSSGWQFSNNGSWGYVTGGSIANTSIWKHVCCTVDNTTITTYLNGIQVASAAIADKSAMTNLNSSNFIEIGCDHPGGDEYLTGYVNDFRVYDHALSPKEVHEISKGLVLHYPLDNNEDAGEGNIVYDCSGYGHHGMWYGNKSTAIDTARYSKCTYLDNGQTTYIQSNGGCGNPSDAITMNIWFKSSNKTPGSDYHHMFNGLTTWVYIEMAVHKDGYLRCGLYINGTRYVANCGSGILDGKWHMLTMTYDGANIKRYVDGALLNTQAATGTIDRPNDPFIFGHGASTGYYCKDAYLSDARIYATALSAADILELYKTAAVIDNQQNLYAYEFVEDDDAPVYSTGVVKTNSLTETTKTQIYNDGQIKANALYEF